MDYKNIAGEFLKKYQQHPDFISLKKGTEAMVEEMKKGLNNEPSSLMMIPTYLSTEGVVKLNEPAIAIDAGGSNLRIGLINFTKNGEEIEGLHKQKMLGTERALTNEEFIEELTQLILPYMEKTDKIGFCFSFPSEILPNKDGRVIKFNKNVNISGAENTILGEEIRACLKQHGITKDVGVVVLNDTVSTLLGGPNIPDPRMVDGQVGLILGTGTNTAYSENIREIKKLNMDSDGKMIINMESGGFDKFPLGEFDKRMDAASSTPGEHLFEKCVSGIYLGNLIAETVKQAAKEGLFSKDSKVEELPSFGMSVVDAFLRDPYGDNVIANACANEDDVEMMTTFIDYAIDRASKLVVINLAACIMKMDGGKKASAPARIVVEGSTFHKCYGYKERIEYYMQDFVVNTLQRHYLFTSGDDVNLAGSAIAAILNA